MAIDCRDSSYTIQKVDSQTDDIIVNKGQIDQSTLDITLLGKRRREYGEIFNENLLRILENFSSPEDGLNPGNPDPSATSGGALSNPTIGQLWHNSTNDRIYHFTGFEWKALGELGDVAGNYGTILNGEQLPRPVSTFTGYVFPYSECSWVISPANYPDEIDYMACYTDDQANVTFEYRIAGQTTLTSGTVNYQIIGIRDNSNLGVQIIPTPVPTASPTPTQSVTPTPSGTPAASSVATPTPTPTPTLSLTPTPSPSTGAPPASPTPTPTQTPTPTPTSSVTPSPGLSPTPTPTTTPTPTPTPSASSDNTGELIQFGNVDILEFNTTTSTVGIVLNGYTNQFLPSAEDTRYHYRTESAAIDTAIAPFVDMGSVIGDEPASWQNEYWVYFTNATAENNCVTYNPSNSPLNTWINLGSTTVQFVGDVNIDGVTCTTDTSFTVQVYMQRSVSQPVGLGSATLMGTLVAEVSQNDPV